MKPFAYSEPKTIEEASSLLEEHGETASLLAGGTDLVVRMKQGTEEPEQIINLKMIGGLDSIEHGEAELHIGPAVKLRDVAEDRAVREFMPMLSNAVLTIGTPQIRNLGTIGGNLCNASPCADTAPALLVFEAKAVISGPRGTRTAALHDFFTGPGETCLEKGELLTSIVVPIPERNTRQIYLKHGPRKSGDTSVVSVALAYTEASSGAFRDVRLALGSVAPFPLRIREAEQLLEGSRPDDGRFEEVREKVQEEVRPISDVRGTESYRRDVAGTLTVRALNMLTGN